MSNCLRKLSIPDIITHLQVLSLWLLVATLPLRFSPFTRTVMIIAGALFICEYIINQRWREWSWSRDKWFYVAMIAFYLYIFIWHIGSDSFTPRFNKALEQRLAFVLCGVIGLLGFNSRIRLRDITWVFIAASILTSLYIIYHSGGFEFFTHTWKKQSYYFALNRIEYINSHMVYNLYLNITLVFAFALLSQRRIRRWTRVFLSLACLWIVYILCLTEGRVGLFTTLVLLILFVFKWLHRYGWKVIVPVLLICGCACTFIMMQNERMTVNHLFKYNPRTVIWEAGWKTVEEAPILGQGVCDARQTLIEKAHESEALMGFWEPYITKKKGGNWYYVHPHNAFLEVWGEFGLIGLFTLLFLLLYPLSMQPKKHRIYLAMIIICFGTQCLFDAFLVPLLYGLSIILFTSQSETSQGNVARKLDVK